MKLYRGTVGHPIVFPESVIITSENLDSIDFDKVVYCEISSAGAMGNAGGILLYLLDGEEDGEDNFITYETNVSTDEESYEATSERMNQKANFFVNYSGGFGNDVYVRKDTQLEVDEEYNCFWYHSQNTKLRIDSSVRGVFLQVVSEMTNEDEA